MVPTVNIDLRKGWNTYQLPGDAMVEIFDGSFVSVGGECTVGCPIGTGVKEFDCVCYPCLSGCHPWMSGGRDRCQYLGSTGNDCQRTSNTV